MLSSDSLLALHGKFGRHPHQISRFGHSVEALLLVIGVKRFDVIGDHSAHVIAHTTCHHENIEVIEQFIRIFCKLNFILELRIQATNPCFEIEALLTAIAQKP